MPSNLPSADPVRPEAAQQETSAPLRFLQRRFKTTALVCRLLENVGWLVGDKIVRLMVGLVVGVWIARHLGPELYGTLNYALALAAMFSAVATFGLADINVRDFVRHPEKADEIAAAAFVLRLVGSAIATIISLAAVMTLKPAAPDQWLLTLVIALMFFAQTLDVIDTRCQALLEVRPIVLLRNIAFLVVSGLKVVALLSNASVLTIAVLITMEYFVAAAFLFVYSKYRALELHLGKVSWTEMTRQLRESWIVLFRLVAIGIYMRVDQVMLGYFLGDKAVGIYAAAARISELWYLIPVAVTTAFNPRLTELHRQSVALYEARLVKIMRLLVWLSAVVAFAVWALSPFIINTLYGSRFAESSAVLTIHIWGGIIVAMGQCSTGWFINTGLLRHGLYQTAVGAVVCVTLNAVLIPSAGVVGAACALIASQFVSAFLMNALSAKTRPLFRLQLRSMVLRL